MCENRVNESERINEKRIKRNEHNLRDLQDNIKRYNIRIIGVPEEEDKKKDHEKILEEIIVENFPKMGKEIITQVQETQRVPNRINPRRNTPIHHPSGQSTQSRGRALHFRAEKIPSKRKNRINTTGERILIPLSCYSLKLYLPI